MNQGTWLVKHREVRVATEKRVPVLHVQQRRHDISSKCIESKQIGQGERYCDHSRHHQNESRQKTASPSYPEVHEVNTPGCSVLDDEERRDEVSAQDEEQIDAEKTCWGATEFAVVRDDRDHRQRS